MSDHSKQLAEEAWVLYEDALADSPPLNDILAQHEAFRLDAFLDAMSDSHNEDEDK